MLGFKEFITEAKGAHLEHLEDEVFLSGPPGVMDAINFLISLTDMLGGN